MKTNSLLLTVGPLEMEKKILEIGANKIPYFRTTEFSNINLTIFNNLKKLTYTKKDSHVALLAASGTGAMEAAIINTFNKDDYLLIVVGGSFGERFSTICEYHNIRYKTIKLEYGHTLESEQLSQYKGKGFTGVIVNAHETSTCVYYDLKMIGDFCKEEGCLFVVDAISSFLADPYYMDEWNIDITILSSQKALALPPGLSILIVNDKTAKIILENRPNSFYFDLKKYFNDAKRGQTPFTPAVGILIQLNARLEGILSYGIENIINDTKKIAFDFREKIKKFPFHIPSNSLSNSATPLQTIENIDAQKIVHYLEAKYNIFVNPNGGKFKNSLFRVGHIGNLTVSDNDRLINAFNEMKEDGLL